MSENKTSKYLKYALGEIVLVVLGILIALSINNWNEGRKSDDKTRLSFKKTHSELAENIKKANYVISVYRGKDSIIYKVLNQLATKEDYRSSEREYFGLLGYGEIVDLTDANFHNLSTSENNITEQEDSLITKLQSLYSRRKREVDILDASLPEYIFGLGEKYRDGIDWYYDYINFGRMKDEAIDYYLNNQSYLNEVTYYKTKFYGQHLLSTIEFKNRALDSYKELSNYLKIEVDTSLVKDINNYKHYQGTFLGDNTVNITLEDDNLRITFKNNENSTIQNTRILYPDSKIYFTIGNAFGKLFYNERNEVTHLLISNGARQWKYKKVN